MTQTIGGDVRMVVDDLRVLALVCTLAPTATRRESSSDLMATQVLEELSKYGVTTAKIRIADYDVKPGVAIDMGGGDEWPEIRERIMEADILLIATPIWMGHPASITQKVMERLDAELSEIDEHGRLRTYGKVGVVAIVGNEDGAHNVTAQVFQALSDVGFTIPASGAVYWVGEAMQRVDYKDLKTMPDKVRITMQALASNAAHLARRLKDAAYPPLPPSDDRR